MVTLTCSLLPVSSSVGRAILAKGIGATSGSFTICTEQKQELEEKRACITEPPLADLYCWGRHLHSFLSCSQQMSTLGFLFTGLSLLCLGTPDVTEYPGTK